MLTYTIQGTSKDAGILPRSIDVLFNSIEGKHYDRMNLEPRFCTDVTRLTDEEEHRENNYKSTLLSSLDKEISCRCLKKSCKSCTCTHNGKPYSTKCGCAGDCQNSIQVTS